MVLDYAHFGDVVTFDTTFGANKEYRPFGVFLGLNQFRETTIFAAALLFDETEASFTWLFETFLGTQWKETYNYLHGPRCSNEKSHKDSLHKIISWTMHLLHNAECC